MRTLAGQRFLNNLNSGGLPASANNDLHLSSLEQFASTKFRNQVDQTSSAGNTINNVIEAVSDVEVDLESEFPPESPLVGLHSDPD